MSTALELTLFVGGPVIGALCAFALGYTRGWEIMIGVLSIGWMDHVIGVTILAERVSNASPLPLTSSGTYS